MTVLGALPERDSSVESFTFQIPASLTKLGPVLTNKKPSFVKGLEPSIFYYPSPQSIVARRVPETFSTLSDSQVAVDLITSRMFDQASRPSNVLIWAGAGVFTRMGRMSWQSGEIVDLSRRLYVSKKMGAVSLLPLLAAAGCEAGVSFQDGHFQNKRDGGVDFGQDAGDGSGIDFDKDGVPQDLDCDDEDPNVFPLMGKGRLVKITQSTQICPGTYKGFTLEIPQGSEGIELNGTEVWLDGKLQDGTQIYGQAIRVDRANDINIYGFHVRNYVEDAIPGAVRVQGSSDVRLSFMEVLTTKGTWPIRIAQSSSVDVNRVSTNTHSDRGLKSEESSLVSVHDSNFLSGIPYDYVPADGLLYFVGGHDNVVMNNTLISGQGEGLKVEDELNMKAEKNTIKGNGRNGILIDGTFDSYFGYNVVTGNMLYGAFFNGHSKGNDFTGNTFTGNTSGPYGIMNGTGSILDNTFTNNNPQP